MSRFQGWDKAFLLHGKFQGIDNLGIGRSFEPDTFVEMQICKYR